MTLVVVIAEMSARTLLTLTFPLPAYKISEASEVIFTIRASWKNSYAKHASTSSDTNTSMAVYQPTDDKPKKYGVVEHFWKSKVLFTRRNNLRKSNLTMVNVILDSNNTKKHLDDRL